MKLASIKINKRLGKHKPGSVVRVEVDDDGTPKDRYWRSRLKDADIDNCCELLEMDVKNEPIVEKREKPKKKPVSFRKSKS